MVKEYILEDKRGHGGAMANMLMNGQVLLDKHGIVDELKKADLVILAEIYAARERNLLGISSLDLQREIPGSVYCKTLPAVTDFLRENAKPGDIVLTVGAGDIFRAGEALFK